MSYISVVRLTGLEPARRETPDPKSGASTNSATGAHMTSRGYRDSDCKGTKLFSFYQKFSGKFYDRIFAAYEILVTQSDCVVGRNAKLYLLLVAVVGGAGGETHRPSVGKGIGEWKPRASAGAIADDLHLGEAFHNLHEIVGSAENLTVCEQGNTLMPPKSGGWLYILWLHRRELVVPFACLVLDIAYQRFLLTETGCQFLGIGECSAAVASDVEDQTVAECEILKHLIKVTFRMR